MGLPPWRALFLPGLAASSRAPAEPGMTPPPKSTPRDESRFLQLFPLIAEMAIRRLSGSESRPPRRRHGAPAFRRLPVRARPGAAQAVPRVEGERAGPESGADPKYKPYGIPR